MVFFIVALNYQLSNFLFPGYTLYDVKRILEIALLLWFSLYLLISVKSRRNWLSLLQQHSYFTQSILFSGS